MDSTAISYEQLGTSGLFEESVHIVEQKNMTKYKKQGRK